MGRKQAVRDSESPKAGSTNCAHLWRSLGGKEKYGLLHYMERTPV
jgi:hypothetical protein